MPADTGKRIFTNKDEFYAERGGARSGESDFGVHWRSGASHFESYLIAVVHDTGDVYAEKSREGTVILLTTLPFGCAMKGLFHKDKDRCPYEIGEQRFAGWAQICGQPNSFEWFKARC